LPKPATLTVLCRMASELDQPRLFRVQLQLELLHTLRQFRPEPFGIVLELESNHESSRPGELHPQALTDSGLARLRSSGSYRPVAA